MMKVQWNRCVVLTLTITSIRNIVVVQWNACFALVFWYCLGALSDGTLFKVNENVSWIVSIHDVCSTPMVCLFPKQSTWLWLNVNSLGFFFLCLGMTLNYQSFAMYGSLESSSPSSTRTDIRLTQGRK